jgi:NADH-quinone oxidoreductase subunit G
MAIIEIDGKKLEADAGAMIIEVADAAGISIPRFCYHKKLTIAANCRMCLVEVEKSKKPLPACATPITDGMKVFTQSPMAISAQKAVMEFLLINHPLDCPICDQGGECELQDVSMGYGGGASRYTEEKRSVNDENLGPLVATEMTRCIHCTRCLRFCEEIGGLRELGGTYRGEKREISTYVGKSLVSEISGNIIDLCPVGALTNKPYRYTARTWELQQVASVSPHDCWGSAMAYHVRRNDVMRAVPKEQETINESWISDRDRYSYLGLRTADRLQQPQIKENGEWKAVDWETALTVAVKRLQAVIKSKNAEALGALCHPSSTTEEAYLLQKLLRALGSNHIDHRITETDVADQASLGLYPQLGIAIPELEQQQTLLLIGYNAQREQPLAAVRLRKASLNGAAIYAVNPIKLTYRFALKHQAVLGQQSLVAYLTAVVAALKQPTATHDVTILQLADQLKSAEKSHIIIGALAQHHPEASTIRALVAQIAELTGATFGVVTHGANSAGAWLAGAIPHRREAGHAVEKAGLSAQQMLQAPRSAYILMGLEPADMANPALMQQAMSTAETVIALSSYDSDALRQVADVLLPLAPASETAGTYVNINGTQQTVTSAVLPFGESRPGWKILRVLANLLNLPGFEYEAAAEIHDELQAALKQPGTREANSFVPAVKPTVTHELQRITEWALYGVDPLVRRASALQQAASADKAVVRIHSTLASQLKLKAEQIVTVRQGDASAQLALEIADDVPPHCVWIPAGMAETAMLGEPFGGVTLC